MPSNIEMKPFERVTFIDVSYLKEALAKGAIFKLIIKYRLSR